MARFTHGYPVTYFQTKGAKVHFNFRNFTPQLRDLDESEKKEISLRYGVIEYSDLVRDLRTWETLLASSMMQRPHSLLTEMPTEVAEASEKNLASALAFSAITLMDTKEMKSEVDLYEQIVMIPHYEQKRMALLDKEDEHTVVKDNFAEFQRMYHPLVQSKFKEVMEVKDGRFECDRSYEARKYLAMHINDNVLKNLS